MSKFRVKITRTEVYEREVEVEAEDAAAAEEKAKENEAENEYAVLFDCPDTVTTDFACKGDGNSNRVTVDAFKYMTVSAEVDWDFDEDVLNSGLSPEEYGLPSKEQTLYFDAKELESEGIVEVGETNKDEWWLNEDKLKEYISETLTEEEEFCHKGFTFSYTLNYNC